MLTNIIFPKNDTPFTAASLLALLKCTDKPRRQSEIRSFDAWAVYAVDSIKCYS